MNSTAARLRWLFAAQVGLSLVQPLAALVLPFRFNFRFVTRALYGISLEPPMFLVFWCAFSGGSLRIRLSALGIAAAYLAGLSVAQDSIHLAVFHLPLVPQINNVHLWTFLDSLAEIAFFFAGSYSCLAATRLHLGKPRLEIPSSPAKPKPTQFSLQDLFVITLVTAVYLGIARTIPDPWVGFLLYVFLAPTIILLASWAALGSGYVRQRVCFALIAALLAGLAHHVASKVEFITIGDRLLLTLLFIGLPTAILIGSFLILRAWGYRLVPTAD